MKKNIQSITEAWSPMITKTTGVKDPAKLEWMSQLAHNTAKALNEDLTAGGAYQHPVNGTFGGVYQPYSTLYNTLGVGNVVPAGRPALTGADYADNTTIGSGDKYPALLPIALKVAAKTIGFELVNTTPLAGPSGVLPYMDYVYSGSKQPYGATPAHDASTANPHYFQDQLTTDAKQVYTQQGLPHAFKASVDGSTGKEALQMKLSLRAIDASLSMPYLQAGDKLQANGGELDAEFIGWSRIDADPMFKIVNATKTLGTLFEGEVKFMNLTNTKCPSFVVKAPRLISMLEDQIQGFTGAGPLDNDPWYGTYQDGTRLYEPMTRGTGELQYARQLSLQLFTKNVIVGTISVGCAVTQEQVSDLQKQWGIDVVKMVENAGINELSATINRHITSRLFALGWKNQVKLIEVEGQQANLNITFDTTVKSTVPGAADCKMTPAFAIPQGAQNDSGQYEHQVNVALPFRPLYMAAGAAFENRDTLLKRLSTQFLAASNWVLQRGRYGAGTFAVTNITVATALQTNAQYAFSPFANNISQNGGSLYPCGTMAGLTIYVDPLMAGSDTRILVGRKGGKDEPGVHFCPYIMAESVKMIAEGTAAPKLVIKSRYALIDAGFFPETQYLTFCVDFANLV